MNDRDRPVALKDVKDDLAGAVGTDSGDSETGRVGRHQRASDGPRCDLERGSQLGERREKHWR